MSDAIRNPAEEPQILPAQAPAWLKPSTIVPIVILLCAGIAVLFWQISKSEKARTESNLLLATQPGATTWATLIQKYPGQPATAHWGYADPSEGEGSQDEKRIAFLKTLHMIRRRLELFTSLPASSLEKLALEKTVRGLASQ
jgi:hypothetical protein